ncbi:calponin homology domain-containing protein DDB_G0272472-like [Physella acuta]|uniref:calponin homology domain-containing protein DDB_G0272472-like n=1 Tax=Physella acuta TaxID=109671 RepID=UPI0027DE0156|nr:calponin homology domain-containing protein DDB_G0272472-like [Physella acuta]
MFRAEFPEHCLFHLQSILLQSCWTRQQEIELGLHILVNCDAQHWRIIMKNRPEHLLSLHVCIESLKNAKFTTLAENAEKLLDRISSSLQAELDPPVERKKTRTENWKDEEKNELLSLIERNKREIECKGRTSECKKKVKQAWDDLTQEHRAKYPSRDLQKVKEQYQRMKSLARQDMKRARRDPHGSRLSGFTRRIFDICPEDFVDFKELFESELNTGNTTEPDQVTDVVDGTSSGSFQPSSSLNSEGVNVAANVAEEERDAIEYGNQESTESHNEQNMDDGVASSNLHVEANFNENQELIQEMYYGTDVQAQKEATDRIRNQNIEMQPQPQIADYADTEWKRKSHPSIQVRHGCRNLNKRRRFGDVDELEVEERRTKLEKEKVELEISKLRMREKEEKLKQRTEKHDVEIQLKKQKHEQRMREREEKLRMEIERHVLEQRLLEQKLHKEESKGMLTSSHEILDVAGPSYTQL